MEKYQLGEMEARFADLIWERAPVASGELVGLCAEAFSWKKSTTYTMLHRLCDRGIFANEGSIITAQMSRDEFYAAQGAQLIDEAFSGSLPRFLAAFTRRTCLSEREIAELEAMIEAYKKGE